MTRAIWAVLGIVFVVLGFVGALLPLMPTTIFLILAAGCFSRSSPRLEAWLLDHPCFGPTLRAWRRDGAISRRAKMLACAGMGIGFALFWWQVRPNPLVALIVGVLLAASALFIVSRPLPPEDAQ